MSTDTSNPSETPERPEDEVADERTPVALSYRGASQVISDEGGSRLALFVNRERDPVRLKGTIKAPLLVREALSCLYDVVSSDFRYVPKDRSAYLAYQRMKKSAAGLSAWQAQQAYYEWMARNDPLAFLVLDPVVTVHPDALLFEVFSKDEGTYAQLAIDRAAVDVDGDVTCGTTNIDYSKDLFDGVQRMRSYRETRIDIGDAQVEVATATGGGEASAIEKQINVPDTWLRGFLQVQSAATLPTTVVKIAAIDLYNVLRKLRLHKDEKKKGRGIRVELVPGEAPRLVLEPWEEVITTDAGKFAGKTPAMIRIWGRRRLMLLRRLLPFAEEIELHLLGSGLPSFYVIRAGAVRLTLGLSGFTSANWAQAVAFDLLLPRGGADKTQDVLADILGHLAGSHAMTAKALAKASGHKEKEVLRALQLGCQHGQVMFDLAGGVYRHRPLLGAAIDAGRLEFRNLRERVAHDLIAAKAAKITQESQVYGSGLEITGEVKVKADRRAQFRLGITDSLAGGAFGLDLDGRSAWHGRFRDVALAAQRCRITPRQLKIPAVIAQPLGKTAQIAAIVALFGFRQTPGSHLGVEIRARRLKRSMRGLHPRGGIRDGIGKGRAWRSANEQQCDQNSCRHKDNRKVRLGGIDGTDVRTAYWTRIR